MIAEGIQRLVDLAQSKSESETRLISNTFEPRKYYELHDGKLEMRDVAPTPKRHTVYNLRDLVALATSAKADTPEPPFPSIWHSHSEVRAVLEGQYRQDWAVLKLTPSVEFAKLSALSGAKLKQADLLTLLRVTLAGCMEDADKIVAILRTIKVEEQSAGNSTVNHGSSSLGKSVQRQVQGAGGALPPEMLLFHVPVYVEQLFGDMPLATLRVDLRIMDDDGSFVLTVYQADVQRAIHEAQDAIEEQIGNLLHGAHDIPVYYGVA